MGPEEYRWGRGYATGLGIGIILGVPMGLAMQNLAIGPALGVAIGAGLGMFFEQRYNPEPLLSTDEQKKKTKLLAVGFSVLLVSAAVIFGLLFMFLE